MNTPIPSLADALAQAELLHDRATLESVIADLGRQIDAALDGERAVFLTVMNGALIFAGHLALAIRTDLEFDYVHATRYRGATSGSELHWLREPAVQLAGRTVLLVDDILDEGHTLKAVRDDCYRRGAKRVLIASLCTKRHDRLVEGIASDFNGVELPDRYVFGYGMDYYEQGRNLPGIYALKAESAE
ncbi:hypoxanthine-guanine phosphoribosyltransferase [Rhodanobacter denitrificans]|uniref:Hypoxanthine-guanine phosphoribosyltransferase n=1 Tax=Rhodanobacter denitrificans TaxID=666685 RepID=M4NEV1_9GAMM|nr:hypoxanthine-guanine phosphoribosyltransferase [Rhodanobacter denitrificans]AGG89334.1 hypoxanthine-guanine phosphoribosyltransferase [Rhodanobacter denitrificans]UJM88217.1 hypoxanthine-guanine phosphoribosyltransferase [Rhodanobacter denitrificans]